MKKSNNKTNKVPIEQLSLNFKSELLPKKQGDPQIIHISKARSLKENKIEEYLIKNYKSF